MEHKFWEQRWVDGQTNWHQPEFNRNLSYFWKQLNIKNESQVLVPLCGKSKDMIWLRDQGHPVIGVELSAIACSAFFLESHLKPQMSMTPDFQIYESDKIKLFCGDFFKFKPDYLENCSAVYDRAAYIALPPEMRKEYAHFMAGLVQPESFIMLQTLEFDSVAGPPFSISQSEIIKNWGLYFSSELLHEEIIPFSQPQVEKDGVEKAASRVYLLKRKHS